MNEIRFLIIIPVYKVEKYIRECLDSVFGQTYGNFHIYAIDDGTPDRSGEICEEYAVRDSRITVLHQKNQGQLAARQAGIHLALEAIGTEDYFVFLDSDDTLMENALETAANAIRSSHCDMLIWGYHYFDGQKIVYTNIPADDYVGNITSKAKLYQLIFCRGLESVTQKVIAAKLFDRTTQEKYYDVRVGEDSLQCLPLYPKCSLVTVIPEAVYCYRRNPDSITLNPTPETYRSCSKYLSACWDFLEKENVWNEQEWKVFADNCLETVGTDLSCIARMEASRNSKLELVRMYLNDPFFQKFISAAPTKPTYLYLAKRKLPGVIVTMGTLTHALGNLKRKLFH